MAATSAAADEVSSPPLLYVPPLYVPPPTPSSSSAHTHTLLHTHIAWQHRHLSSALFSQLPLHYQHHAREEKDEREKKRDLIYTHAAAASSPLAFSPQLQQIRALHATRRQENLVVGGLIVAGSALALQYGLRAYNQWQEKKAAAAGEGGAKGTAEGGSGGGGFARGMSSLFAKRFYEGGFEDKMTRREAALILGVRESASPQRIKEAHRRILMLNHPDTGGSTYIASKINEAKEMLLKGKT